MRLELNPRRSAGCALALTGLLALSRAAAQSPAPPELQNWFNDPFFQVSSAVADCPLPRGPYMTDAERLVQTHHRAEKGTTCWLSGACDRPNVYAYDQDIAAELRAAAAARDPYAHSTLWVTVQGRVVYFEGCVERASMQDELEAFARSVPWVQQAIAIVRFDPAQRPPYALRVPAAP